MKSVVFPLFSIVVLFFDESFRIV